MFKFPAFPRGRICVGPCMEAWPPAEPVTERKEPQVKMNPQIEPKQNHAEKPKDLGTTLE